MQVLVTGGTGYLGRAIAQCCVRHGHMPVVFARSATTSGVRGRLVDGDVRDRAALELAARGCDAICHTAALVSVWRPRRADFDEVNVGGLVNVLTVAEQLGIARLVYTSTFLALPPAGAAEPLRANDYQRTKVRAHAIALESLARGFPLVCLYPGVVYGPGALTEGNLVGRLITDHLAGRLPGLIGADHRWSYAFVDDVAEGHVAALERAAPGTRYCLGGENAPQMRVFEILRELTGRRLPRRIPLPLARALALVEAALSAATRRPPRLTWGTIGIFACDWTLESDDARRDLDYRITPLAAGIRVTYGALRAEGIRA